MTNTSASSPASPLAGARPSPDSTRESTAIRRLRLVLRANATTSFAGGAIALVAGSWLSRELGIDHVALTRIIGAGLIAFAVQVVLVSRARESTLLREALLISLADAAWVIGSIAVIAAGVLTTTGAVVIGLVAVGVGDFGIAQFLLRRQATTPTSRSLATAAT